MLKDTNSLDGAHIFTTKLCLQGADISVMCSGVEKKMKCL